MGVNAQTRAHVVGPASIVGDEPADLKFQACVSTSSSSEVHGEQNDDTTQLLEPIEQLAIDLPTETERPSTPPRSETLSTDRTISTDESEPTTPPSSRKEKRKAKNAAKNIEKSPRNSIDNPTKPITSRGFPQPSKPQPSHDLKIHLTLLHQPTPSSSSMPPTQYYPLLICSLGNPGKQYANTLHSAGHTILDIIRTRGQYVPFQKGMSGLVSTPNMMRGRLHLLWGAVKEKQSELAPGEDNFTLWQSTKLMNVSGPSVRAAWTSFSAQTKGKGGEGRLVVLHDELEAKLGDVSIREGKASPKGHNGIKSVQNSMKDVKFWRVGVGIGRPESRDPAVVSKHVLRKMTVREEQAMQDASFHVLKALRLIAEGNV